MVLTGDRARKGAHQGRMFLVASLLFGFWGCFPETESSQPTTTAPTDEFEPLRNQLGEIMVTGKELPISGEKYALKDLYEIKVTLVGEPEVIPAHPNYTRLEDIPQVVQTFDSSQITRKPIQIDPWTNPLVNKRGDTIPAGIPVVSIPERVAVKWPKAVPALPPSYLPNATLDISYLNVEHGLPKNLVMDILEDSRGRLWISTYLGGVSCYDGKTLRTFTTDHGLMDNIVYSLLEDRSGRIWMGTHQGLMYWDGEAFYHFKEDHGFYGTLINILEEDQRGTIWFGGSNSLGFARYDGRAFTYYPRSEGTLNRVIGSIIEGPNGNIVLGAQGGIEFDGKTFTHINNGLEKEELVYLFSANNAIWHVNFNEQIRIIDGNRITLFPEGPFMYQPDFVQDQDGNIWLGSQNRGILLKYDGAGFTSFGEDQGIGSRTFNSPLISDAKDIWFGTSAGVRTFRQSSFQHPETLSEIPFRAIMEDSRGNIWFGSLGEGIFKYDGQNYYKYDHRQGFPEKAVVWEITEDSDGDIWFATQTQGFFKLDGQVHGPTGTPKVKRRITQFVSPREELNKVISIQEDAQGSLWIGLFTDGLLRWTEDSLLYMTATKGLVGNQTLASIVPDQEGDIWVASWIGGVSEFRMPESGHGKPTVIHYSQKEGLSNALIRDIMPDGDDRIWMSDLEGDLFILEKQVGKAVMESYSIRKLEFDRSSNSPISMVRDADQNIWLATDTELERMVMDPNSGKPKYIQVFSKQDGLRTRNFMTPVLLDRQKRIWWGTDKGVSFLETKGKHWEYPVKSLQLTDIEINDRSIDFRNLPDSLTIKIRFSEIKPYSNIPENLILNYNFNSLALTFSGIEWSAPHQVDYSFRLIGLEENWSESTKNNRISYQRLGPGKYVFQIRARSVDQVWSEPYSYSFFVQPPFWLTWWAYLIYSLVGGAIVYLIIRLRTRALQKQKERLEDTVSERTSELERSMGKLKETQVQLIQSEKMASLGMLTASIAHEINNPLNFTELSSAALNEDLQALEKLLDKYQELKAGTLTAEEVEAYEKEMDFSGLMTAIRTENQDMQEGTHRISEIVNGLLAFSRGDQGQKEWADIHLAMDRMLSILSVRTSEEVEILKEYDSGLLGIYCNINQISQVFLNVLTNAMDAVNGNGQIRISTRKQEKFALISIKDNGIGMSEAVQKKAFDPFFTTKEEGKGTGLGLSISHGIMEGAGGSIELTSQDGQGTEVVIRIPLEPRDEDGL